jgi:hypothetical protein
MEERTTRSETREVPSDALIPSAAGDRWLSGIIDLLLETDDGADYKTFPGSTEGARRSRCAKFAQQLMAYAEAYGGLRGGGLWGLDSIAGGGRVEISSGATAACS